MKCNRCGKEIEETEIFCDDCKKYLKKFSSRSDVEVLEDKWTVVTKDKKASAHFEHTVHVTDNGPEILTKLL